MAKAREKLIADLLTKLSGICKANNQIDSVGITYDGYAVPGFQIVTRSSDMLSNLHTGEIFFKIHDEFMNPLREVFDYNHIKDYIFFPISEKKTELFSSPEIPTLEPVRGDLIKDLHKIVDTTNKFLEKVKSEHERKPFVTEETKDLMIEKLFERSLSIDFHPYGDERVLLLSSSLFPKLTKTNIDKLGYYAYSPSDSLNIGGCVFELKHTHFDVYFMYCFTPLLRFKE